jgi:hypothetical protein
MQKDSKERTSGISNDVRVVKEVLGRIQLIGWIRDKEDIKIKEELMAGSGSVLHRMPELTIRVELEDNIYQKILKKNLPEIRKVFYF